MNYFNLLQFVFLVVLGLVLVKVGSFLNWARKIQTKGVGLFFPLSHTLMDLHEVVKEKKIKDFGHFWFGGQLVTFAVSPEAAKFVLINTRADKNISKRMPPFPRSVEKISLKSLVWANGEEWRHHRLLANSAFNETAYDRYFPKMSQIVEKALSKIEEERTLGKDLECSVWMSRLTVDVLGTTIFGMDFGALDDKIHQYYEYYRWVVDRDPTLQALTFLDNFEFYAPTKKLHKGIEGILEFVKKIIEEKLREESLDKAQSMISLMVHSADPKEGKMTEHELISDIFTFFLAGHDTTASTLQWAFYELAQHPDVQDKLYDEINKTLGDRQPKLDEINLPYLDCFISENLRLHPGAGTLPSRGADSDLDYNGLFIPKGSVLCINYYSLHRDPDFWTDPEKFDPDRFLPENKLNRHRFAYIPFAAGSRQCIGMQFSLIQQRLFLIRTIQRFKIQPPKHNQLLRITIGPIMLPKPHIFVSLESRQ